MGIESVTKNIVIKYTCVRAQICMYVYICMYVCMCVRMYEFMYVVLYDLKFLYIIASFK